MACGRDGLSPQDQANANVLVGNYSQASAVRFFGRARGLPLATSGHLTYHLWGPEPGDVIIAYGLSERWLRTQFAYVTQVDEVVALGARPFDTHLPVYVCRGPLTAVEARWAALRRFHNAGGHGTMR